MGGGEKHVPKKQQPVDDEPVAYIEAVATADQIPVVALTMADLEDLRKVLGYAVSAQTLGFANTGNAWQIAEKFLPLFQAVKDE